MPDDASEELEPVEFQPVAIEETVELSMNSMVGLSNFGTMKV